MEVIHLESNLNEVVVTNFEGDYDEDTGEYVGFGTIKLDNDCTYEGQFLNGMFHGKGKFSWPDGVVYEGDFYRNSLVGHGSYSYPDGSIYVGGILDGKRHGQGKLTNSAGQIYEGSWVAGLRHGVGKMCYNEEQTIVYSGDWVENNREGYGTMKYASGNSYEGHWHGDQKSGFGVMLWRDMDEVYLGDWVDDKPHGYGEHIWGESTAKTVKKQCCNMYRGAFHQGQRQGHGTFFYMNGSVYTGFWHEDEKHGPGVFVHQDGKIVAGDYEANRLKSVPKVLRPASPTSVSAATAVPIGKTKGATAVNVNEEASVATSSSSSSNNGIAVQYHLHILDVLAKYPSPSIVAVDSTTSGTKGDGSEYAALLAQRRVMLQEIERLLLKYNGYLKSLYLRYNDQANRLRQRDVIPVPPPPDLSGDNAELNIAKERVWRLQKVVLQHRLLHRRLYCASLGELLRFLREVGLVHATEDVNLRAKLNESALGPNNGNNNNTATFAESQFFSPPSSSGPVVTPVTYVLNAYDVAQCCRAMKAQHRLVARDEYVTYLQEILRSLDEQAEVDAIANADNNVVGSNSLENGSPSEILGTENEDSVSAEDLVRQQQESQRARVQQVKQQVRSAQLSLGALLDEYLSFEDEEEDIDREDGNVEGDLSPVTRVYRAFAPPPVTSLRKTFEREGASQLPLLEHEFVELFVRAALEYGLRMAACANSAVNTNAAAPMKTVTSSNGNGWQRLTPYMVLEKVLAEKVLPLALEGDNFVSDVHHELYDANLQDLAWTRNNANVLIKEQNSAFPLGHLTHLWTLVKDQAALSSANHRESREGMVTLAAFVSWVLKSCTSPVVRESTTQHQLLCALFPTSLSSDAPVQVDPVSPQEEEGERTRSAENEDTSGDMQSLLSRRIVYEDFVELLVRLFYAQPSLLHEKILVPVAVESPEDTNASAAQLNGAEEQKSPVVASTAALLKPSMTGLQLPGIPGGDVGTPGSSVLQSQMVQRLLRWLEMLQQQPKSNDIMDDANGKQME